MNGKARFNSGRQVAIRAFAANHHGNDDGEIDGFSRAVGWAAQILRMKGSTENTAMGTERR
ncbi:hypothetical protein B5P46_21780 [Rhizobium leguminosarum]|uniref:Uncharacterized protein n=1 Tax=Rhizobium leguminosarum TaxID=384 RepID=A0A4Q1TUG3_RHILE|nr:hypothetical protein B5P46_21780 [Rhizobium leguminosarum]